MIEKTLENQIKWLGRFYRLTIEHYIEWNVTTMEEDGGAWDRVQHRDKTLEGAIEATWVRRRMDEKIAGVLKYRELNYPRESDQELGLTPSLRTPGGGA